MKYLWRMDANPWEKVIEKIETDREQHPVSLKDVHVKYLKDAFKRHLRKCRYSFGRAIFKKDSWNN